MTRQGLTWVRRFKIRYAVIIVVIVPIAAITYIVFGHMHSGAQEDTAATPAPVLVNVARASIHPMDTVVNAQGTLAPPQGGSANIAVVNAGRLLSVLVREGDHVVAGQLVATVDGSIAQAQAQSAAAALRASQNLADQAALAVRSTVTKHANAVKVARLELQTAETELRKLQHGARPQEIAQADQAVNQANATYERAVTELSRVKYLYEKGIDAKRELDDAQTSLSVSKSALETARQEASLLRAGARFEDVHAAELKVETARANLQAAEEGSLQVTEKEQEAQAADASVKQKIADLAAARTVAGYSELRSPISGVVVLRTLNPGDMADASTPVLKIASTRTLDIEASIAVDQGNAIRSGMPVRVTVTGSPRLIMGSVLDAGQIDPQTGLLGVRISVPNQGGFLKIGAFAMADIVLHVNPSAVVVPKQAVVTTDGSQAVFVVGDNNIAHSRKVTTGAEENGLIEIANGISPGERVIVLGQYELADGAEVRISGQNSSIRPKEDSSK